MFSEAIFVGVLLSCSSVRPYLLVVDPALVFICVVLTPFIESRLSELTWKTHERGSIA